MQEHSAPISCPTPNFAKGSCILINIDAQDAQDLVLGNSASCMLGHPQTRIGWSPRSNWPAATSRPVYPCSSWTKYRSPPRVRRPPNGSVFAWRLGFCGSPPGRSDCPWERGRPARILFLLGVAEHQRDFAGSHHVGGNRNGQAEGEPGRRCRSIQVEELAEAVPCIVRAGRPRSQEASNTGPAAGERFYLASNRDMPNNRPEARRRARVRTAGARPAALSREPGDTR